MGRDKYSLNYNRIYTYDFTEQQYSEVIFIASVKFYETCKKIKNEYPNFIYNLL